MNKKYLLGSAFAALAATVPTALYAQQLPPPVVAVLDTNQIFRTCAQCVVANTNIQQQLTALQQRVQALQAQIQGEEQQLNTLVRGLNGAQPDAALTARINAFQQTQQNAQREIDATRDRIQRTANYVEQQIGQRIRPALTTVMQQRGATVVLDRGQLLDASPALDITPAVLAIVNQNTAPLSVTLPPAPPPAAGSPPAPATPGTPAPRPRPQGR